VHSAKDVPGELADGLVLVSAPPRAAAEDVLCGASSLDELAPGSRVGTSSIRRIAQLRAVREDLELQPIHGNVDTRLRKLHDGELDAIVLARAGLQRLAREHEAGTALDLERFVPAPGQGTLALQARADDAPTHAALRAIGEPAALACLLAERALARALDANCETPLGALAVVQGERMRVRAWVGLADGSTWVGDELDGDAADPERLGREVARRLALAGAGEILDAARERLQ
jgi:hydroxymethylbilane synthase